MDTEKKAVPQDPLAEYVIDKALLCRWADELNERMGLVSDPDATGEQAQALSVADGVRPEDNLLSSGIIEARYGDEE